MQKIATCFHDPAFMHRFRSDEKAFTRERKLTFAHLVLFLHQARLMDGKLLLVTNVRDDDMTAAEIVTRYKSLADIERGFRALKSEIEIGPVYHRLPQRIKAHAMICFLALILHRVMRMRLKASDSPHSPERALRC